MEEIISADTPDPISIDRYRELLGDEAVGLSDEEIDQIRRHADTSPSIAVAAHRSRRDSFESIMRGGRRCCNLRSDGVGSCRVEGVADARPFGVGGDAWRGNAAGRGTITSPSSSAATRSSSLNVRGVFPFGRTARRS